MLYPTLEFTEQFMSTWLESCKRNPTVDFLLFTDCNSGGGEMPCNLKVYTISFSDLRERIARLYNFPIALNKPYKLCDFRPAYGHIFEEELKVYDFWGFCDMDMISSQ